MGVDNFTLGGEPCGLGCHEVAAAAYPGLKTLIGKFEVFFGVVEVALCLGEFLVGQRQFVIELIDLKFYHLLGFFYLAGHFTTFGFGGFEGIETSRMGYGDVDRHACHEGAVEFVLESVEDVGVGEEIASRQTNIGHERRAGDAHSLLRDAVAYAEHLHLTATAVDVVHIDAFGDLIVEGGKIEVGNGEDGVERHAAALGKQHLGKEQSVGGFGKIHLRLIEFHADTGKVALGGHIGLDHFVDVVVKRLQEGGIFFGHLFFMLNGDDLPVGFVDGDKGCLALLVVGDTREVVGQPCGTIEGQQFAAHEEGLGDSYGAEGNRMGVEFEGVGYFLSGIVQGILDAGVVQDVVDGRTHHIAVQAEVGEFIGDGLIDIALDMCAQRVDFVALFLAEKVDLFLHPGVGTVGTHFGKHLPQRHLFKSLGFGTFDFGTFESFVGIEGTLATRFERDALLSRQEQRNKG